jgi:hypothetical protein
MKLSEIEWMSYCFSRKLVSPATLRAPSRMHLIFKHCAPVDGICFSNPAAGTDESSEGLDSAYKAKVGGKAWHTTRKKKQQIRLSELSVPYHIMI